MFPSSMARASLGALVSVMWLAGTTPAAPYRDCVTDDATGWWFTTCNGTTLTITEGTATQCVQIVDDGGGGTHFYLTVVFHAKGQDDAGNSYVANVTEHQSIEGATASALREETLSSNLEFIGQGKAPNFRCKMLDHITLSADGIVATWFEKDSEGCECQ